VLAVTALAAVGAMSAGGVPGAGAGGGDLLDPARDRYEPGQRVTMIGYTQRVGQTWRTVQFYGYLEPETELDSVPGMRVGPVTVEQVATFHRGRDLRVSIEFSLPDDLAPGRYLVDVCDRTCTTRLGYIFSSTLFVGMDPDGPVIRDWPLDDPAIRWLEDDALLAGPQWFEPLTAADVRAGRIPTAPPLPAPQPLPEVTAVPASEPAPTAPARAPATRPVGDASGNDDPATDRTATAPAVAGRDDPWPALGVALPVAAVVLGILLARRRRPGRAAATAASGTDAPGPEDPVPLPDGPGTRSRVRVRL
jgi:hypothetical protein